MNQIKHIIWDWNGTLVDDAWLFVDLMNLVLKKRNLATINVKKYQKTFCFPLEKYYKRLGFNFNDEPYSVPATEFIALYNKEKYRPKLYPGARNILTKLCNQKIKNYLLSAQNHDSLLELVRFYKIGHFFELIQGTDNIHARGKELLAQNIMTSQKIKSNEVLFIGDTNMDVEIAQTNKAKMFALTFGHQNKDRFPQHERITLVHTLTQLYSCLFGESVESR